MLYKRHSLCSRSSLMSSTSRWACSRHRKSSLAVASHWTAKSKYNVHQGPSAHVCCVHAPVPYKCTKLHTTVTNSAPVQQYLPCIVEDGHNKHGHEKNGDTFSPDIVRPVWECVRMKRGRNMSGVIKIHGTHTGGTECHKYIYLVYIAVLSTAQYMNSFNKT